jgi:hemolysin III
MHSTDDDSPRVHAAEWANTLTHGAGLAFSVVALAVLVVLASLHGSARAVVACSVYGATLVLLYLASTLYHGTRHPRAKRVLQIIDHAAIYLLIAGSYTPYMLVSLGGAWGWSMLGVVWGLAILGVLYESFFFGRLKVIPLLVYLGMGWMIVVALRPLLAHVPLPGILWLLAGGLAYTVGVAFYVAERWPYMHAIWHLFVMGGSACHFISVLLYVLPRAAAGVA